jgi:hypothetical protein
MTFWAVTLASTHFDFEAYGLTEREALAAFARLIRRHGEQYGASKSWMDGVIAEAVAVERRTGCGYRDHEEVRA